MLSKKNKYKRPEIMSPIRDWASLEACKDYTDAVYFGLPDLSLRAHAGAITMKDMGKFVDACHENKIKAYLTVNAVVYDRDLELTEKIIKKAKADKVDAVIVWDPWAIEVARKVKINFFISTQANVSNWRTAEFYKKLGAKRVVLARELSLDQIKKMHSKTKVDFEAFVHGAMCVAISGRCVLSSYLYGTSANCGVCAQPCRKQWMLSDTEGSQVITEGKYFLSAKDLRMIEYMPELIKAGVVSFKIEGRRRDPRYIAVTARCYREAVDSFFDGTFTREKAEVWKKELATVYNRGFSTGFYFSTPSREGINYEKADNVASVKKVLVGHVYHYLPKIGVAEIKLNHRGIGVGDKIIFEGSKTFVEGAVESMQIEGKPVKEAKKGESVGIKVISPVRTNDKVFVLRD